jgi:hypothetical protein
LYYLRFPLSFILIKTYFFFGAGFGCDLLAAGSSSSISSASASHAWAFAAAASSVAALPQIFFGRLRNLEIFRDFNRIISSISSKICFCFSSSSWI